MEDALQLVNTTNGQVVAQRLEIARTFWRRFWGLQFRRRLPAGHGLLLFPSNSVHTCFLRFPIDVLLLDQGGRVVKVRQGIRPWRAVLPAGGAVAAVELPAGSAAARVGDVLRVVATSMPRAMSPKLARLFGRREDLDRQ